MASGEPLAIAEIWREWEESEGRALSFTILTVNAQDHPLMSRFHRPGDEKRSLVIIRPDAYQDWPACSNTDEVRLFLTLYRADEWQPSPRRSRRGSRKPNWQKRRSCLYAEKGSKQIRMFAVLASIKQTEEAWIRNTLMQPLYWEQRWRSSLPSWWRKVPSTT
jgi:hypothetical protein